MEKFLYLETRLAYSSTFEQIGTTLYGSIIILKKENSFGLIDENFNKLIEPQYEEIHPAFRMHFWGKLNGVWHLYDFNNHRKIQPQFADVSPFHNGFSCVSLNGENYGFIDKEGGFVIAPVYQKGIHLGSNLFVVSEKISENSDKLKYGVINQNEEVVYPFTLDEIPSFTEIILFVLKQRKPLKEWLRL